MCLRQLSVHVYNPLKTPVLVTVFLLLLINVVFLVSFFYVIMNTCVWPAACNRAFVTPTLKFGSPNDFTNYRPISILHPPS